MGMRRARSGEIVGLLTCSEAINDAVPVGGSSSPLSAVRCSRCTGIDRACLVTSNWNARQRTSRVSDSISVKEPVEQLLELLTPVHKQVLRRTAVSFDGQLATRLRLGFRHLARHKPQRSADL